MAPILAAGNWNRPESLSIIGFALMFLLYTLGGLAIWHHRRIFMRGPMAIIVFLIAICYSFAVSLWVIDRLGIYEPYSQPPPPVHTEVQVDKPRLSEKPLATEKSLPTEHAHDDTAPRD